MASCEKCWNDSKGELERYSQLIMLRVCSPEEQAGPEAGICPSCKRKTLHQHTNDCMAGCRGEGTKQCSQCKQGWTCEKHPGTPWPHDECAGPGMPCQNRECHWRAENFPGINEECEDENRLICSGCGGEINPDYGKCQRCG